MNKKVNIYFTNFSPIGSRTLQNFYLSIKCQNTNIHHKSPIIYGAKPNFLTDKHFFWQVELNNPDHQIICQLFFVSDDIHIKNNRSTSVVILTKTINSQQQKQTIFYEHSKKIGILNYIISETIQKEKNTSNLFYLKQQSQQSSYFSKTHFHKQQNQFIHSQDFQDERYQIDFTPTHSNQNSFVKFDSYSQVTNSRIFANLDQSLIPERHHFEDEKSFMVDQSFQNKKQDEISSLQKWLIKLKNVEAQKNKTNKNVIELIPIIPQKYLEFIQSYDAKLNFKSVKFSQKKYQNFHINSLSLAIIDDQDNKNSELLFNCNFSVQNSKQRTSLQNSFHQIKFKSLFAQILSNNNIQLKIQLKKQSTNEDKQDISGIFIKDKFLKDEEIPLFNTRDTIVGKLLYKAKKTQNTSVQCLPPIQQNPSQITGENQTVVSTFGSSPQKSPSSKFKIRQRKLNNLILRKQNKQDFKIKKYSYDEQGDRQVALHAMNSPSPTKSKLSNRNLEIQKLSIKQNSQFSSEYQFQRSNTEELPFFQLGISNLQKSSTNRSQDSPNIKYEVESSKHNFLNSSKITQKNVSPSKNSLKMKNQHYFHLRSTNLTDLQEEQSEEQEVHLKGDTFSISLNQQNSQIKTNFQLEQNCRNNRKSRIPFDTQKSLERQKFNFIIEISSVTVILYQNSSPEEQQSGKFLILKSDKGETFITETLFNNHLNLSWKQKSYRFTSSLIQISLYERTGYSSQCQNKMHSNVIIKFIDLMKSIQQNFYRQQIWLNGQAIGTVVLLYDILMEKHKFLDRNEQNSSEMQIKNTIERPTRSINKTEMIKKSSTRNQDKSTIKISSQQINRKRAKTLESNKNSIVFPSIEKNLSRKSKMYEGGKNIKIGRAQRFLTYNMGEILGQL